jgi:hypothetical protein
MRHSWAAVGVLLVALATAVAAGPKQEKGGGIFAPLKEGQTVALKEAGGRFEIAVVPGLEAGHKVVEVGPDFIVLVDAAGVTETRIPVWSVKAVTVTRLPRK